LCLVDTLKIGGVLASAIPALLAASVDAIEFDPDLLFGAAGAFSTDSADTPQTYIRISCTRGLAYTHRFILEGSDYTPVHPLEQSFAAEVEGRLECGYHVQGEFSQSGGPAYASRSVLSVSSDTDTLVIGDLPHHEDDNPLIMLSQAKGVRFMKGTDSYGMDALVSTPQAEMRTEYLPGKGTQGPYTLTYTPLAKGTEKVALVDGLTERQIQPSSYRMDHDTGSLTFVDYLVPRHQFIKVSYQQLGNARSGSIRRIRARHHAAECISLAAEILSISRENHRENDKYTFWGLDSKSQYGDIDAMIAFDHSKAGRCRAAGSQLGLHRGSDSFEFCARYRHLGKGLAELQDWGSFQQEIETSGRLQLPLRSALSVKYLAIRDKRGPGSLVGCGFSVPLPCFSRFALDRTFDTHSGISNCQNTACISRETESHSFTLSMSSGRVDGIESRGCSSFVKMAPFKGTEALLSGRYLTIGGSPAHSTALCRLGTELAGFMAATLSIHLNKSGEGSLRRMVRGEITTRRSTPVALTGEYSLRCLSQENEEIPEYREVHDLTGSARVKVAGFNLVYHPRLSHSRRPELIQHRLASQWALTRQIAIEAATERARHSPPDNNITHDSEVLRTGCRISPTSYVRAEITYRSSRRTNPIAPSNSVEREWRTGVLSAIGEAATIETGFTDLFIAQSHGDSGASPFRDRTEHVKGTRELSPCLLAYIQIGFTRRDAKSTGYSRTPGVGLILNTGSGTAVEVSYRTVMWEGIPGRDSEKLSLELTAAETWLSSNCKVEYMSLSRPISKTLELSVEASLHF